MTPNGRPTTLQQDLATVHRWLFGQHEKGYCSYTKKWWERRSTGGPCLCDEPRDALTRIKHALNEVPSNA